MLADALRRTLVREVRSLFNDTAKGEKPVPSSDQALLPRGSVAWRVHGDVTTMMVGGVSALLLQMLHPSALAGVWDHSNFRGDMQGRLRRTARFIAVTTFGHRDDAHAAIERVRAIHAQVAGVRPDGGAYRADDPHLLAWVHVAGAIPFLDAWIRFGEPRMSAADQDCYFADVAPVARALGADPVPTDRAAAEALLRDFRAELASDARSRKIARIVLNAKPPRLLARPAQTMLMQAAVDLLPPWARRMQGLHASHISRAAVHGAVYGMADTLRWAFARPRG